MAEVVPVMRTASVFGAGARTSIEPPSARACAFVQGVTHAERSFRSNRNVGESSAAAETAAPATSAMAKSHLMLEPSWFRMGASPRPRRGRGCPGWLVEDDRVEAHRELAAGVAAVVGMGVLRPVVARLGPDPEPGPGLVD